MMQEKTRDDNIASDNRGQTFMEFILLLFVLLLLSLTMMRGMNIGVGKYWKAFIAQISADDPSSPRASRLRFSP